MPTGSRRLCLTAVSKRRVKRQDWTEICATDTWCQPLVQKCWPWDYSRWGHDHRKGTVPCDTLRTLYSGVSWLDYGQSNYDTTKFTEQCIFATGTSSSHRLITGKK